MTEILTPAQITDHDMSTGFKSHGNWPVDCDSHRLKLHLHFRELVEAWKVNPYRREHTTCTVDELAESKGMSRFVFCSKESRDDFIIYYDLHDFVLRTIDPGPKGAFYWLELENKFTPNEVNKFLEVYNSAMNNLAAIEAERRNAIHVDGEKVGLVTTDHFTQRECYELDRIRRARSHMGMGAKLNGQCGS